MAVRLPLMTARLDEERNETTRVDGDDMSDEKNTLSQKMMLTFVV